MIKLSKVIAPIMVFGMVSSCYADVYQDGKTAYEQKRYFDAVSAYTKSCERGNPKGCLQVASMYENGEGIAQNKYLAASFYTQACRGGESLGCGNMSLMYDTP